MASWRPQTEPWVPLICKWSAFIESLLLFLNSTSREITLMIGAKKPASQWSLLFLRPWEERLAGFQSTLNNLTVTNRLSSVFSSCLWAGTNRIKVWLNWETRKGRKDSTRIASVETFLIPGLKRKRNYQWNVRFVGTGAMAFIGARRLLPTCRRPRQMHILLFPSSHRAVLRDQPFIFSFKNIPLMYSFARAAACMFWYLSGS